jgi:acetyl-CoA carboxylase biotin carboxyl carrier protein
MAEVLAPMSGNIWKILVQEGDKVQAEQELLIMEAMKMEIPIPAPKDGTVKTLLVKEGEPAEADSILVVLE